MKQVLVVVAAIALGLSLVAAIVSLFWAKDTVALSAARSWPGGLGTSNKPSGWSPRTC
jgi:hypothetical protein